MAAHGVFRDDNPLLSSLRLSDGDLTVYDLEGGKATTALTMAVGSHIETYTYYTTVDKVMIPHTGTRTVTDYESTAVSLPLAGLAAAEKKEILELVEMTGKPKLAALAKRTMGM